MDTQQTQQFILGGNARFTIRSKTTGVRFTYRVRAKEMKDGTTLHFVSVLTGSDNDTDFMYLGTIFEGRTYRHGKKSPIGSEAPSAMAFTWTFPRLMSGDVAKFEVHHEDKCGKCARSLTVPESVECGFGPICAKMLGIDMPKAPSAPQSPAPVEDDQGPGPTLPGLLTEPGQTEAAEP